MSNNQNQKPQKINLELPENVADGIYANFVLVAHSQAEFILDFARITPGAPKTKVQSRIIMNPINAVRLMKTLEDNIKRYESTHGPIDVKGVKESKEIGFNV